MSVFVEIFWVYILRKVGLGKGDMNAAWGRNYVLILRSLIRAVVSV